MRRPQFLIGVLLAMTLLGGCGQSQQQKSTITLPPAGANHGFSIDLQEGFNTGRQVIVKVDGREIYRGAPETNPLLGLAEHFSTASASTQPVLTVTIPQEQINWSKQIDLSQGTAVGISLTKNGPELRQAPKAFGYD